MNLRKFSWSLAFFKPADTYKIETITPIIRAYPSRKYVCVGDSGWFERCPRRVLIFILGELDPEIYSKLYVLYPENISHIFIRDVCWTPVCLPACKERYRKAFEAVPASRWTVFKDPKEIETNIEKLIHD
jgi:phosphatidate phosphatase APP1